MNVNSIPIRLIVVLFLYSAVLIRAEPEILSIQPAGPPGDAGAIIDLTVDPPSNAAIKVQTSTDVGAGAWNDATEFLPVGGAPLTLSLPNTPVESVEFFRLASRSYGFEMNWDTNKIEIIPTGPVFAEDVMQALTAISGRNVFLRQDATLPSGPLSIPSTMTDAAENLFQALGIPVWIPPISGDDSNYVACLTLPEQAQTNPLPDDPLDSGPGVMEDGWPPDTGKPDPTEIPVDPPPGQGTDKLYTPTIPDVPDNTPQDPDPSPEEGEHVRLRLRVDAVSQTAIPISAVQCVGDAMLPGPMPTPTVGDLVWVVRDGSMPPMGPIGGGSADILFLGSKADPFQERAYDPPPEIGSGHGSNLLTVVSLSVPIPIPAGGQVRDLRVELYRLAVPSAIAELTAEEFDRNISDFTLLAAVTGAEMIDLFDDLIPLPPPAPTLEIVHRSGSKASKFNLVIMGDGFTFGAADQALLDDVIENTIMADFFSRDIHPEILNAINVWKINLYSLQSGVTQMDCDGTITTARNTALEYRYTGDWDCCWAKGSANTGDLIDQLLANLIPEADGAVVILNQSGSGGCNKGDHFVMTRTRPWSTVAHEFGHFFAGLSDEYFCTTPGGSCKSYTGDEPDKPNLTKQWLLPQIKWNEWIPPGRPVPTQPMHVADNSQDVGLFVGGTIGQTKYYAAIFKPSVQARMDSNSSLLNPIGYTEMHDVARTWQEADMTRCTVGDFNGDGFTDVVLQDGWQYSLHLAADRDLGPDDPVLGVPPRGLTGVLEPAWYANHYIRNDSETLSWQIRTADRLYAGDFDGDGLDDLYVVNLTSWNQPYLGMLKSLGDRFVPVRRYDLELPGWDDMQEHDEFYVADFNGDNKKDLFVFNGLDWNIPYLIMLRSTGTALEVVRRYDEHLTGISMGPHETFHVCNTDGDNKEEVISHNPTDWSQGHIMVFSSDGSKLNRTDRWYGEYLVLGFVAWALRSSDVLYTGDFNGDGSCDMALFNGFDWSRDYLSVFVVNGGIIQPRVRYDPIGNPLPGWQLRSWDRFHVANVNGDLRDDLVVYNTQNWDSQYLGMLKASGDVELNGTWQKDWVGGWNLGSSDQFHVADFRGGSGWDDLLIANAGWFGLLRSYSNQYALESIYRKWIHNHRFHKNGFW